MARVQGTLDRHFGGRSDGGEGSFHMLVPVPSNSVNLALVIVSVLAVSAVGSELKRPIRDDATEGGEAIRSSKPSSILAELERETCRRLRGTRYPRQMTSRISAM